MREAFSSLDLLGLAQFPVDEYDSLADAATSVLSNHGSVDEAVERVAALLHSDWGTTLVRSDSDRLRNAVQELAASG
jgi:hypothetical protein